MRQPRGAPRGLVGRAERGEQRLHRLGVVGGARPQRLRQPHARRVVGIRALARRLLPQPGREQLVARLLVPPLLAQQRHDHLGAPLTALRAQEGQLQPRSRHLAHRIKHRGTVAAVAQLQRRAARELVDLAPEQRSAAAFAIAAVAITATAPAQLAQLGGDGQRARVLPLTHKVRQRDAQQLRVVLVARQHRRRLRVQLALAEAHRERAREPPRLLPHLGALLVELHGLLAVVRLLGRDTKLPCGLGGLAERVVALGGHLVLAGALEAAHRVLPRAEQAKAARSAAEPIVRDGSRRVGAARLLQELHRERARDAMRVAALGEARRGDGVQLRVEQVARARAPLVRRRVDGEARRVLRRRRRVEGLREVECQHVREDWVSPRRVAIEDDDLYARARHGRVEHLELLVEQRVLRGVKRLGGTPTAAAPAAVAAATGRGELAVEAASDDAPRTLVGGAIREEVEDEDVVELQPFSLKDSQDKRRAKLGRQPLLGRLRAHEHRLMRAKLDLAVCRVRAEQQDGEVGRVGAAAVVGGAGEQQRLRPVKVAAVALKRIDRVREELEQDVDELGGGAEDAVVRAIVDGQLVDRGHLHPLVAREVVEVRALQLQRLLLRALRVVEHRRELLEAEADAARDGLARVAREEERVLVAAHIEEEPQLRLRKVLHLVDKDLVDARPAEAALLRHRRVDVVARVHHVVQRKRHLPRLVLEVEPVHGAAPARSLVGVGAGVGRGGCLLGKRRRDLLAEAQILLTRKVAHGAVERLRAALDERDNLAEDHRRLERLLGRLPRLSRRVRLRAQLSHRRRALRRRRLLLGHHQRPQPTLEDVERHLLAHAAARAAAALAATLAIAAATRATRRRAAPRATLVRQRLLLAVAVALVVAVAQLR